jgi:hypothetical protein
MYIHCITKINGLSTDTLLISVLPATSARDKFAGEDFVMEPVLPRNSRKSRKGNSHSTARHK